MSNFTVAIFCIILGVIAMILSEGLIIIIILGLFLLLLEFSDYGTPMMKRKKLKKPELKSMLVLGL